MREIREILFRGKCCTTGEWVEGFLGIEELDDYVIQQFSFDEYFASECIDQYSVKLETVGRYTGLTDKNDKKIFEGDILKISFRKEFLKAVVKFGYYNHPDKILKSNLGFYFDFVDSKSYRKDVGYWTGKTLGEIEVIGNIHDNPELLKGSAKNE